MSLSRTDAVVTSVVGGLALTFTVALGVAGNSEAHDPSATATQAAEPTDTGSAPTPAPAPVAVAAFELTATSEVRSISAEQHLTGDAGLAPDQAAVDLAIANVTALLDEHLTSLQAGDGGTLGRVALPGLFENADPVSLAAVTSDLADGLDPAVTVELRLRVQHDGPPQWVRAVVSATRASGATATSSFVFVPIGEQISLVAFGHADATAENAP